MQTHDDVIVQCLRILARRGRVIREQQKAEDGGEFGGPSPSSADAGPTKAGQHSVIVDACKPASSVGGDV